MLRVSIRLMIGGIILATMMNVAYADPIEPDPAWKKGTLSNGFSWQILATPQRPNDRIEVRLLVNTGSLVEDAHERGFSTLLPRIGFTSNSKTIHNLWQNGISPDSPLPPVSITYDYTTYNISLPNNNPELLKNAFSWLAEMAGGLKINEDTVASAQRLSMRWVAIQPANVQDSWWRFRLKGSPMLGHEPVYNVAQPIQIDKVKTFYHQWYTPDAMILYVAGNIDTRMLNEQINTAFSGLKGKRSTPSTLPSLAPLSTAPLSLLVDGDKQDNLSLVWERSWQPVSDTQTLFQVWKGDLAREGMFIHLRKTMEGGREESLSFDCDVQYQRSLCGVHINAPRANVKKTLTKLTTELVDLHNKGITQAEFDALLVQKNKQLTQLFATYARTETRDLMRQRLQSKKNGVVDIAPEEYQKLRQDFLGSLTVEKLNQEISSQLSQEPTLIIKQPKGEEEENVQALKALYSQIINNN